MGGIVGPLLLGGAVATFFNGSNFLIDKGNITNSLQPVMLSTTHPTSAGSMVELISLPVTA